MFCTEQLVVPITGRCLRNILSSLKFNLPDEMIKAIKVIKVIRVGSREAVWVICVTKVLKASYLELRVQNMPSGQVCCSEQSMVGD